MGDYDLVAFHMIWGFVSCICLSYMAMFLLCQCYEADRQGPWASCFVTKDHYEVWNFKTLLFLQFLSGVSQISWWYCLLWWNTGYYFSQQLVKFKKIVAHFESLGVLAVIFVKIWLTRVKVVVSWAIYCWMLFSYSQSMDVLTDVKTILCYLLHCR